MTREQKRIPVYSDNLLVERCDQERALRLARAPNVIAVKRGGQIDHLRIVRLRDDSEVAESTEGSPSPTYEEKLGDHSLVMLKRVDDKTGRLVPWSDGDGFNPRRFNPDVIEPLVQTRAKYRR